MKYRTRPGVVLTTVCGENLLVAAKAARPECPYVTQINDSSAFLWRKLAEGADADGLMAAVEAEFEVDDPAVIREAVEAFIAQMLELNYLLPEEHGGNSNEEE